MNAAAAHVSAPAAPATIRTISPFPTTAALALERASQAELELAFIRGSTPDVGKLVDWQFRGINHPGWAKVVGIKKFVKGFYRQDGEDRTGMVRKVMGYNCGVEQNVLDGRWHTKPNDTEPKRFGFYEVTPVDATARDNAYLHAVLLDYGKGGNRSWDPTARIRDYLVQVDPANPDLYLGKAYLAIGPARVYSNFFILERFRRA